jgi:WD40 repeat protein
MKNKSQFLLVILIILVIVVLGALKGIDSKIDSIDEKVSDQHKKIITLYDYVDSEINLEEQVAEKQEDESTALKIVNEFNNSQYMSKAKFHPQKNIFAVLVGDGTIELVDAVTTQKTHSLRIPDKTPVSLAFQYDGQTMLLGMKEGDLCQINITSGEYSLLRNFSNREIVRLDTSKNGYVAVGLGGSVEDSKNVDSGFVYDPEKNIIISKYAAFFRDDFQGIAISPEG